MLEDVAHLGRGKPPVDRHRDRAEMVRGEDGLEKLDAVVGEHGHDIACSDATIAQPARERSTAIGHLAVGDGGAGHAREWPVGRTARVVFEHGAPTDVRLHPPSRAPVTRPILYRPFGILTMARDGKGRR